MRRRGNSSGEGSGSAECATRVARDKDKIAARMKGQAMLLGLVLFVAQISTLFLAPAFATLEPRDASTVGAARPTLEVRALWVLRNTLVSRVEIDRMLRQAKDAGFNLLFVQVRGRGDAFYNSSIEPRAELLADRQFDPLAYLLTQAHRSDFAVHLWLNAFLVWSAPWKPTNTEHVMLSHPDWVAVRSDGRPLSELSREEVESMGIEGVFLAPGNPGVREHIRAVVRELVQNYDVDGVHLDYVRYPDMAVGYDRGTRTEFMRCYGVDPDRIANNREAMAELFGKRGLQDLEGLWKKWRVSSVDALVDSVRCDLKSVAPRVKLSAAVVADPRSALGRYAQDWPAWLERGTLDFAVPMCYSASTGFVRNQVRTIKDLVGESRFYPGIAMYNQSPGRVVEKVRVLRQMGIKGFSMFCYDPERSRSSVLRELSRTVFADAAVPWP
ncbi:MAG: family 10 glycosylhydrolase [Candidatus Eisenbacteria bacterium]|nr:family 10 glycosylhydrolase [Candidatus Eisenbacteria bacterium]